MLKPGDVVGGDFEILQRLGGGGMGAVYLVHQRSTDAVRALKVMLPHWLEHHELVQRFEQEARACGRIESEHVVEILAYGVDAVRQLPWLVMQYLPGETLQERVQRLGAPCPSEAIELLEQFFHGLGAAHRAGVVHRDLKPQNVYVAKPQRVGAAFTLKLLDFGIAKLLGGTRAATQAMGTRAWMAPEQELCGAVISPAADLWAVGLIVFWLLSARHFWLSIDAADSALSYEIYFQSIPLASARLQQLDVDLPLGPAFDRWLGGCLQRDPALRYQTVEACWSDLKRALSSANISPRTAPIPRSLLFTRNLGTTSPRYPETTTSGPQCRAVDASAARDDAEALASPRSLAQRPTTTLPFITAPALDSLGPRRRMWPALVTAVSVLGASALLVTQRSAGSDANLPRSSAGSSVFAAASGPALVGLPAMLLVPSAQSPQLCSGFERAACAHFDVLTEQPLVPCAGQGRATVVCAVVEECWVPDEIQQTDAGLHRCVPLPALGYRACDCSACGTSVLNASSAGE